LSTTFRRFFIILRRCLITFTTDHFFATINRPFFTTGRYSFATDRSSFAFLFTSRRFDRTTHLRNDRV
jgi:hypothetical protein